MRNSQIAVGMTNESKQQNGLIPATERLRHCCCFSLQVNDASSEMLEDAWICEIHYIKTFYWHLNLESQYIWKELCFDYLTENVQ